MKGGYYPTPSSVTKAILSKLEITDPFNTTILDPCAGCGGALQDLASGLGVPPEGVYAIELDAGRGEAAEGLPEIGNILAPCGFEGAEISYNQFSLIYLNPPYDNQFGGGGREELNFLNHATHLLKMGGILVFVAPINQFVDNIGIAKKLDANYEDCELYTFPELERHYREAVFIAKRRHAVLFVDDVIGPNEERMYQHRYRKDIDDHTIDDLTWTVPKGGHPKNFRKKMYTWQEMLEVAKKSSINQLYEPPPKLTMPRPAMQLGAGHRSLLVISGQMDGVFKRRDEPAFVLRGTLDKEEYLAKETVNDEDLSTRTYEENTINNVRIVAQNGVIKTFSNRIGKEKT